MKVAVLKRGCIKEEAMVGNLESKLKEYNISRTTDLDDTDCLIYMTCAGTGDVIEKTINELDYLAYHYNKHDIQVIVVGCLVTNHEYLFEKFKNSPRIKVINKREWIIPTINYLNDMNKRTTALEKLKNRTLYIAKGNVNLQFFMQEGCINQCSFCKVHYNSKNKLKSLPFDLSLDYLRKLVQNGTKIIHLDGENLTLYGLDLNEKQRLHEFIRELSKTEGLEAITVNELHAGNMYDELFNELLINPKVVSVSFQLETASDRLLKLMHRGYSLDKYDFYVRKLIEAGKYVDTILMSGFPTETMEDLDTTIKYLNDRRIITHGVCEYVDFRYIPSSKLEQLSAKEKKLHTRYLLKAIRENNYNIFKEEMPNQTKLIYTGEIEGTHFFANNIPCITTISQSDEFNGLEKGTIITRPPKKIIKWRKETRKPVYKI